MSRHPSTAHLLQYFTHAHLSERAELACAGPLRGDMAAQLPDGPELTAGLRKLLEAKDCFVRAALDIPKGEA